MRSGVVHTPLLICYYYNHMNTTDNTTNTTDVRDEALGAVTDDLASTNFDEEKEVFPSTEVLDILPMVELEKKEE